MLFKSSKCQHIEHRCVCRQVCLATDGVRLHRWHFKVDVGSLYQCNNIQNFSNQTGAVFCHFYFQSRTEATVVFAKQSVFERNGAKLALSNVG